MATVLGAFSTLLGNRRYTDALAAAMGGAADLLAVLT
jgi:hypothetical protein